MNIVNCYLCISGSKKVTKLKRPSKKARIDQSQPLTAEDEWLAVEKGRAAMETKKLEKEVELLELKKEHETELFALKKEVLLAKLKYYSSK